MRTGLDGAPARRATGRAAPWIRVDPDPAPPRVRLFCFHHAGGAASVFFPWRRLLNPRIGLCRIQLPGREERLAEPPAADLARPADAVAAAMGSLVDRPFAFFGHSMGALLAFEVARRLPVAPVVLAVSACAAPRARPRSEPLHRLSDAALLDVVRRFGGTPDVLLADAQHVRQILPVLRADLEAVETHVVPPDVRLDTPIIRIAAADDAQVSEQAVDGWQARTRAWSDKHVFDGGHFFIRTRAPGLVALLERYLADSLGGVGPPP